MKQSDVDVLSVLRKFSRLDDTQWKILEIQVAKAGGVTKVTGTAAQELRYCAQKATERVVKHPGHADQKVHGNGGKNSNPKGTPAGGSQAGGELSNSEIDAALAEMEEPYKQMTNQQRTAYDRAFSQTHDQAEAQMLAQSESTRLSPSQNLEVSRQAHNAGMNAARERGYTEGQQRRRGQTAAQREQARAQRMTDSELQSEYRTISNRQMRNASRTDGGFKVGLHDQLDRTRIALLDEARSRGITLENPPPFPIFD